jgi:hypothetical protein
MGADHYVSSQQEALNICLAAAQNAPQTTPSPRSPKPIRDPGSED